MTRQAQVVERARVESADAPVAASELARLPQALQEDISRRPCVFIRELARLLETSVRTIRRQLQAGTFFIPQMPKIDQRYRWSRARVYLAIETTTFESHRRIVLEAKRHAPKVRPAAGIALLPKGESR